MAVSLKSQNLIDTKSEEEKKIQRKNCSVEKKTRKDFFMVDLNEAS